MGTVKYHAPDGFLGRRSIESLGGLEGVLDVAIKDDSVTATISPLHIASCEGVYCRIEELGYKARLP